MTTLQNPQHVPLSACDTDTALPLPETHTTTTAWMPLEGVAQNWATFAGTFFTQAAFMATSMAFSALSLEASALRQYSETCRCRFNGDTLAARAAGAQTIQDLQDGSSQWIRALYWLERLASGEPVQLPHSQEEQAHIRVQFSEATAQLHRLSWLTLQVQETCVVLYQRTGLMVEEDARPERQSQGKRRSRDDE